MVNTASKKNHMSRNFFKEAQIQLIDEEVDKLLNKEAIQIVLPATSSFYLIYSWYSTVISVFKFFLLTENICCSCGETRDMNLPVYHLATV